MMECECPSDEELGVIFRRAVMRLYIRWMGALPSTEEMEEYTAECWVRWFSTGDPAERAHPALCAKRAVAAARQRDKRWHANKVAFVRNPPHLWRRNSGLPDDIRVALREKFLSLRKKQGQRGEKAAQRDVLILDFLVQGYSDEGIALETGYSYASIREYRKQIKENLRSIGNS